MAECTGECHQQKHSKSQLKREVIQLRESNKSLQQMVEHYKFGVDQDLEEYREGVSGDGPHAEEWKNKPHRLVYDLIYEAQGARNKLKEDIHEELVKERKHILDVIKLIPTAYFLPTSDTPEARAYDLGRKETLELIIREMEYLDG